MDKKQKLFEKEMARAYLQGRIDAQRELYPIMKQMENELNKYKRKARKVKVLN